MAAIRLGSWESARAFKGIICDDISEFESHMPSHAVGSLWQHFARCKRFASSRSHGPFDHRFEERIAPPLRCRRREGARPAGGGVGGQAAQGQRWQSVSLVSRPAIFDYKVPAFNIAAFVAPW